jgi:hypothetical protein
MVSFAALGVPYNAVGGANFWKNADLGETGK